MVLDRLFHRSPEKMKNYHDKILNIGEFVYAFGLTTRHARRPISYYFSGLRLRVVIEDRDVACPAVEPVDDSGAAAVTTASRGRPVLLADLLQLNLVLIIPELRNRRKVNGAKLGKVSQDVHAAQVVGV
jgi:hypothetical protein